jgi:very-short-patch-repair endonuclease
VTKTGDQIRRFPAGPDRQFGGQGFTVTPGVLDGGMTQHALFTTAGRDVDAGLLDLAERQHGIVGRDQALRLGLSEDGWLRRSRNPGWEPITPRVLRRRGSPPTDHQQALAACLDLGPDAYLSHESAAALWGLPGYRLMPLQVIVVRGHRTSSGLACVHLPRHLPEPFAAELHDIPVVRPGLMLLELAQRMHPEQLRRRLDWLWSRRLVSGPALRCELDHVMHRGRSGVAALREVLDSLPPGYVPPASGLESRFRQLVIDHDLPAMARQVDLGDDHHWCGRVDFRAEEVPLVVEIQSDLYHRALSSVEDDARRRAALEIAGFTVVELDEVQVWHRPAEVAHIVREAYWSALRRRPAA